MPDFSGGGSNFISQRSESKTLTSKMRKILASPKVMKGKSIPSPNKTFGKLFKAYSQTCHFSSLGRNSGQSEF